MASRGDTIGTSTSSDSYSLKEEKGKLYVEDLRKVEERRPDIDDFWKEVIMLRYRQLEDGAKPIVPVDEDDNYYTILKEELSTKGVIYEENIRVKNFREQPRDFMIGKENDKIVLRQIDGYPMDVDETRNNNFFITRIKAVRYIQLQSGSEKIEKGADLHKMVDKEIEKGIILNGAEVNTDILFGRPSRSRRRR